MILYLLRHGETQENADGIVQGWTDTKLNDIGVEQATKAASSFHESVSVIYSSDLQRSSQTAAYFREKFSDVPYFEDKRLRERNLGDAQGTHKNLHDWEVFWSSVDTVSIANAETFDSYNKRIVDFLDEVKAKHGPDDKILIITHGGTIRRIMANVAGTREYQPLKNCEMMSVDLS